VSKTLLLCSGVGGAEVGNPLVQLSPFTRFNFETCLTKIAKPAIAAARLAATFDLIGRTYGEVIRPHGTDVEISLQILNN
jgi:hypothetical protein